MKMIAIVFILFSSIASVNAQILTVKVLRVGCHTVNGQCFVNIDQLIPECTNTGSQLRWNSSSVNNSDALYSTLLAAHATGESVQFGGADASCDGSYASFFWFAVQPN